MICQNSFLLHAWYFSQFRETQGLVVTDMSVIYQNWGAYFLGEEILTPVKEILGVISEYWQIIQTLILFFIGCVWPHLCLTSSSWVDIHLCGFLHPKLSRIVSYWRACFSGAQRILDAQFCTSGTVPWMPNIWIHPLFKHVFDRVGYQKIDYELR